MATTSCLDHQRILADLESLVRETYQLWDEEWVGFSWRNYTFDHAQRVRALTRTLCARAGGDVLVADYAGLLHDVTKSYDGEIVMRDGKRVLDANGFWQNEVLPPARRNHVTELYDELGLAGQLHNESGAAIADALLAERGLPGELRERVAAAIRSHLKPGETASVEGRCLYDSDTIDANIGLPAFYRNIQISLHMQERQFGQRGESLDAYLSGQLEEFLNPYLREKIPTWINGKYQDFVSKMTTEAGRSVAQARIGRLTAEIEGAVAELGDFGSCVERGRLAIVRRFMLNRRNPALASELAELAPIVAAGGWNAGAREMLGKFAIEVAGEA